MPNAGTRKTMPSFLNVSRGGVRRVRDQKIANGFAGLPVPPMILSGLSTN